MLRITLFWRNLFASKTVVAGFFLTNIKSDSRYDCRLKINTQSNFPKRIFLPGLSMILNSDMPRLEKGLSYKCGLGF